MLWFYFILGLIFISLCFKLIIIYYHAQKQRKIKIKPRIKLNHNIYIYNHSVGASLFQGFCCTSRTSQSWDIALILVSKKTCTSFSFRRPLWLWMRGRRAPRSTPQYEEFFCFLDKDSDRKKGGKEEVPSLSQFNR